jgi:hypothetical protein
MKQTTRIKVTMINKVYEKNIVVINNIETLEQAAYLLFQHMKDMNRQRKQRTYSFMIFTSQHEDDDKINIAIKWCIEKTEPSQQLEHLKRPTA